MTEMVSPRATRLATPRWLDTRLVLGVLLVLLSVVAGARVFAAADNTTRVYVAAHDLVPGQHLGAEDLTVGKVRLAGAGSRYVAAHAAPPVGYVVTRFVGAGEIVPIAALSSTSAVTASRFVTVPVQPGHLDGDLGRGELVDVYLTPRVAPGDPVPAPTLVLSGVPVESTQTGSHAFSATTSLAVVLAVPAGQVGDIVHAVESGTVDLVTVPAADSAAAPAPVAGSS